MDGWKQNWEFMWDDYYHIFQDEILNCNIMIEMNTTLVCLLRFMELFGMLIIENILAIIKIMAFIINQNPQISLNFIMVDTSLGMKLNYNEQ